VKAAILIFWVLVLVAIALFVFVVPHADCHTVYLNNGQSATGC
jgi:hypothetical protein